ncbi:unnamed protein product [Closterium sp. NIES-65]|nr:unnamed protein product [Closterium sp. NIES-65]
MCTDVPASDTRGATGAGGTGAASPGGTAGGTRGAIGIGGTGAARPGGTGGATGAGDAGGAAGAGGAGAAAGARGTGAGGTGAASAGGTAGTEGARGTGAAGTGGASATGAGAAGAAGLGGARTRGTGAAGTSDAARARGATGAADPGGVGAARAGGAGAGGTGGAGAAGPGGASTRGAGAAGAGGTAGAGGARGATGAAGTGGAGGTAGAGGAGAGAGGGAPGAGGAGGATGAAGTGGAGGTAGARGAGAAGASGAGGAGGAGATGAGGAAGSTGGAARAGDTGPAGALRHLLSLPPGATDFLVAGTAPPLLFPPAHQSQPPLLPHSPLPAPAPYIAVTQSLSERREPETRASTPERREPESSFDLEPEPRAAVRTRVRHQRAPAVPCTHDMTLRPSSFPQRVVLPLPPASSLPYVVDPPSDLARASSPTVTRFLATVVTSPSFSSPTASALVAELVHFAAVYRLDYLASLVSDSVPACPPSVGSETALGCTALGCDVLEDRQEELECLAVAAPHLATMLLAPEGDPDALDIPTPRSYREAISGEYSSQWQTAMDTEMAP